MEDKTFTQEEVNAIIQDRLGKEKAKHEKQMLDLQKDVSRREKRLQALEKLNEKGLPGELVDLVRLDDDEAFNSSIELLEKTYGNSNIAANQGIRRGQASYTPANGGTSNEDPIRSAMGLKR